MKIERSDLCPCGSGKKYKNCCLGKPYKASPELEADLEPGQKLVKEANETAYRRKFDILTADDLLWLLTLGKVKDR